MSIDKDSEHLTALLKHMGDKRHLLMGQPGSGTETPEDHKLENTAYV